MRYRLVCLDAGFTLLTPRRTLEEGLTAMLAEHGRDAGEEELRQAWEAADRWFWDEYHRQDNDTWTRDDRITQTWRDFHGVMLRELGVGEAAPAIIERILDAQFAPDAWEAYPDVVPMLEALQPARGEGLLIGIVSDWGSNLRDIFVALDLDQYLDFVLASGAVGAAKPDPAFFRIALDRAGVEPTHAVMVGDSYRADVLGARSAGLDGILLDRDGDAGPNDALVIRSLAELLPLVLGTDSIVAADAADAVGVAPDASAADAPDASAARNA
ncbi:MAG: HAD family hydrolase [Candidatus Limnocylindria bacterium]